MCDHYMWSIYRHAIPPTHPRGLHKPGSRTGGNLTKPRGRHQCGGSDLAQGGVPIVVDDKVVGAIGVSRVTSRQDEQIAMAGAAAAK